MTTALVFDPSSMGRIQTTEILQATGLFSRILTAGSLQRAAVLLEDEETDIVFLGWRPNSFGTGRALMEKIRRRESWSDLPVAAVALPGLFRLQAYEAGIGEVFDIATPLEEFTARLRLLLQRKSRVDQLRQEKEHLGRLALTDSLTGLYNRAYFEASLEIELARSIRSGQPCSLLLLDLDHFKNINDTWGHSVGDSVLQAVAGALRESLRRADVLCRFGGEEFALILPGTDAPAAFALAERLRGRVSGLTVTPPLGEARISASIGISSVGERTDVQPRGLIEEADCALYRGKRRGRNRTEIFSGSAASEEYPAFTNFPCGYA